MNILLSTDNNYVMPTGVLMHSICINNHCDITFHVMVNQSFSKRNEKSLIDISRKYGKNIHFYVITEEMTKDFPIGNENMPKHVSIVTYYRLFITEILPNDIHKIIYLDGDMIVRHSLKELWETDLNDLAIGVVHDMDEKLHINSERHKYTINEFGYFNAGMLLINLDYWREHDCMHRFVDYIKFHSEDIVLHDQDVLNTVLYKEKKWVPLTYNLQNGYLYKEKFIGYSDEIRPEIESTQFNPAIIHYCTGTKPWSLKCVHPQQAVWRHYWRLSEWRNNKLDDDTPSSLRERWHNFLLRNNWILPESHYKRIILQK